MIKQVKQVQSKSLRAVGYARTSGESQRDNTSIPRQKTEVENFVANNGWQFLRHYVDESLSGSKIEGRDNFKQMMKDAGVPEEKIKEYIGMMRGFEEGLSPEHKLSWAQRQTYIALGNAVNGAKSLGFDSCPMEGFSPEEYTKILNLPKHLIPTALVAIGIAADEPMPKIRYPKEDLFI